MDVSEFIRTLYLGDRACKSIVIDGWNATVKVHIDCVSRVRNPSGAWDYYTDEDIVDGVLVFEHVDLCELKNAGRLPNDSIDSIEVTEQGEGSVTVEISIGSVESDASHHETLLRIRCKTMYIEDPARPGLKIST